MSRAGAIHTPYMQSAHLQRLVPGFLSWPQVCAENVARCTYMKPSSVWKFLLFKTFSGSFHLQDGVQTQARHSLVTVQSNKGLFTVSGSAHNPLR